MSDLNRVMIIGRLGADPEKRLMPSSNKAVTKIRVATSERWKDKSGDKQEHTEWHTVVAFEKLAEIMAEYLRKGSQVYIEGKLQTRRWQDKQGNDRYSTEVVAREMQMLGGRPEAQPRREQVPGTRDDSGVSPESFDDEIPFAWAVAFPAAALLASIVLGASSYVA